MKKHFQHIPGVFQSGFTVNGIYFTVAPFGRSFTVQIGDDIPLYAVDEDEVNRIIEENSKHGFLKIGNNLTRLLSTIKPRRSWFRR